MIYWVIKIKFFIFIKIIKFLNFIKLNKKQIKNGKDENGKIKIEFIKKKVDSVSREVQVSNINFLLPTKLFFLNFSNFTSEFHFILTF